MSLKLNYFEKKSPYSYLRKKILPKPHQIKSEFRQSIQDYREQRQINDKLISISPFRKSKMALFYRSSDTQIRSERNRLNNSYDMSQQLKTKYVNKHKGLNQSYESTRNHNFSDVYSQASMRYIESSLSQVNQEQCLSLKQTSYQAQKFLFELLENIRPSNPSLPKKVEDYVDSYYRLTQVLDHRFSGISHIKNSVQLQQIKESEKPKAIYLDQKQGQSQNQTLTSLIDEKQFFSVDDRQQKHEQNIIKPFKVLRHLNSNHKHIRNSKIIQKEDTFKLPKFVLQDQNFKNHGNNIKYPKRDEEMIGNNILQKRLEYN